MRDSHALSCDVLRQLARLGVREMCVAAGARNAPLVASLLGSTGVTVRHFFDERSAAFFALGRMMADRRPVAVLTTSGTAAAELLPAVIEAYYQGIPLVLVTADRPASFRGSGSPQAIEQVGLFGCYAEPTIDLDAGSGLGQWPERLGSKPLHVNVCFEEPLACVTKGVNFEVPVPSSAVTAPPLLEAAGRVTANDAVVAVLDEWLGEREGLVVLSGGLPPARVPQVIPFLRSMNAPVVAEATANLWGRVEVWDLLVAGGERALQRLNPRRVVRIGAVPSWRWWRDLEQRPEVQVLNVSESPFPGLARKENVIGSDWSILDRMVGHCAVATGNYCSGSSSAMLGEKLAALCHRCPLAEPSWMRHLSAVIPGESRVFLGNSLPIREWNLTASMPQPGTTFFASRGANGIDGLVSAFLGLGADGAESWLIVGDLSALYDLSAPWILPQLPPANRRIVVINNGGGKIFSRVETLRSLDDPVRAVIENRHDVSFEPWARLWGLAYASCAAPEQLGNLPAGNVVLEIKPDPGQTDEFWRHWSVV